MVDIAEARLPARDVRRLVNAIPDLAPLGQIVARIHAQVGIARDHHALLDKGDIFTDLRLQDNVQHLDHISRHLLGLAVDVLLYLNKVNLY